MKKVESRPVLHVLGLPEASGIVSKKPRHEPDSLLGSAIVQAVGFTNSAHMDARKRDNHPAGGVHPTEINLKRWPDHQQRWWAREAWA
jgi:hypothetical protein